MSERWLIAVTVDPAPPGDGPDFDAWCEKHDFHPLGGGRRAWCPEMSTYLRSAYGVAVTGSGETFLAWEDERVREVDQ